jgi:bisphosphoglycerate-independent phosphoglycerate mutase (AlkP superfamily)
MNLSCATLPLPVRIFSAYLLCTEDIIRVGHTGIFDAAVEAISETDGTIAKAAKEAGYVLAITADHGNAEQMINLESPPCGAYQILCCSW